MRIEAREGRGKEEKEKPGPIGDLARSPLPTGSSTRPDLIRWGTRRRRGLAPPSTWLRKIYHNSDNTDVTSHIRTGGARWIDG